MGFWRLGKYMSGKKTRVGFRKIDLDLIDPPEGRIRLDIGEGEIDALAESIREQGLLSPIEVVARDGRYEVVFGERRYLACKKLGLEKIRCEVTERSDNEIKVVRAVENVQRRDLSPLEEAAAYLDLKEEGGLSLAQISQSTGVPPGRVERRLYIMRMPAKFQRALHEGKVSLGVAEALWRCADPGKADYFLDLAIEHGITVAVAKMWVRDFERELRDRERNISEGVPAGSPLEPTITYTSCEICQGPVEQSKVFYFRACPKCGRRIRSAIVGEPNGE